jgi:hypothetical protein
MLVLGALACTVIFVGFVYVFNYGYALSVVLIAIAIAVRDPSLASGLVGAIALAFGARMLAFTHARYGAPGYAGNVARQARADATMPLPVRIMLWLFVSTLMGFELMPLYYVARSGAILPRDVAGAQLGAEGRVHVAVADRQ